MCFVFIYRSVWKRAELVQKSGLEQLRSLLSARLGKPITIADVEEACIKNALRHIEEVERFIVKKKEVIEQRMYINMCHGTGNEYDEDAYLSGEPTPPRRKSDWNKDEI